MKIGFKSIFTHYIFTTKDNLPLIPEQNRERIEKYVTGIIAKYDCKLYAIYANPDHMHFVVSRAPNMSEEALATIVADSSKKFINDNKLSLPNFDWQQTAAALSISKDNIDITCKYVLNQGEHHKKVSFKDEYKKFMDHYLKNLKYK